MLCEDPKFWWIRNGEITEGIGTNPNAVEYDLPDMVRKFFYKFRPFNVEFRGARGIFQT